MGDFSIKLPRQIVARLLVVFTATVAALAPAQRADSTDLTTPSLLVATRDLQDPIFQRSVILMIPAEPPLLDGLIINDPARMTVRDMFPKARQLRGTEAAIYLGGPVDRDQVSVIFRAPEPPASAERIFGDTYVTTGHDAIAAVLGDPRITELRVILGKAQWLRDQLYSEVMRGSWYIVPAKSDLVFSDPRDLWSTLVRGGDLQEALALPGLTLYLP